MFIIFTGNGKGKTTAALGQAMRAAGHGKRTLFVQFIKGPWRSGEEESAKKVAPLLQIEKTGLGFVGILGDKLPRAAHKKAAKNGLAYASKNAGNGGWHMLVLDEIWNALALGLVTQREIEKSLREIGPVVEHVIATGRDCPKKFVKLADLVTEMKPVKHPFTRGGKALASVEF